MNRHERDRRAEANRRIKEMWNTWVLANRRPAPQSSASIQDIAREELLTNGRVSTEELERRLIQVHHIPPRQAVAEVRTFSHRAIKRLRRTVSPLAMPVTKWGYEHFGSINPDDPEEIRQAVPWGSGKEAYGWVLASTYLDPVYVAYMNHSHASARGVLAQIEYSTKAAAEVGVLPAPVAYQLPDKAIEP